MAEVFVNERLQIASEEILRLISKSASARTMFVNLRIKGILQTVAVHRRDGVDTKDPLPRIEVHAQPDGDLRAYGWRIGKAPLHVTATPEAMTGTLETGAYALAPILLRDGELVGVVCGLADEQTVCIDRDVDLLTLAAAYIAQTIATERAIYVDPITGAFTRKYLWDLYQQWGNEDRTISLYYFDLDNFKFLNSSEGYGFGNQVLEEMAQRVRHCVGDRGSLVRINGDEFVLVSRVCQRLQEVQAFAEEVFALFKIPFTVEGHEFLMTPSIGVSMYPTCSSTLKELLVDAESAMFQAKRGGGDQIHYYRLEDRAHVQQRLALQERLRKAIAHDELELYYQPKWSLTDQKVTSVEALIRWRGDEGRFIPPDQFIPVAEESALIGELGTWVLKQAARQQKAWVDRGLQPIVVAVNVSPKQFQLRSMYVQICEVIEVTGIDPNHLAIEITEGLLVQNSMAVAVELRKIRELGVKIAIDDFGKGYSSLSYLGLFQPTHLKIDQSFVFGMLDNPGDAAIVDAIVHLAHNLGMRVVAEGVERFEQLESLRASGCDIVQGYLFCKPLPADAVETFFSGCVWLDSSLQTAMY
ncbi:MAG: bifunctional diguanylate cyclase/phosphodiesterase [Firmicutes bacterium]|nr:bifunctional diguanylate cyclase/phosphodiesterase [Bacillota bacterium]